MVSVLGSNSSRLRSCAKNPQQTSYGEDACPCVGVDNLKGYFALQVEFYHVQYPAEMGASCDAWESGRHPQCRDSPSPTWCSQSWCYVDPCNCNLDVKPKKTSTTLTYQGSPAYWSYKTCGGMDFWSEDVSNKACVGAKTAGDCAKNSNCAWDGQNCMDKDMISACDSSAKKDVAVHGQEDCRCVALGGRDTGKAFMHINEEDIIPYPPSVGSTCRAWEEES